MANASILRELSRGEELFYKASLSNTALTKISGNIPLGVIQACFEVLQRKHQLLQCVVREVDSGCFFEFLPEVIQTIDQVILPNHSERANDDHALDLFEETLNRSIDACEKLVEIVHIQPSQGKSSESFLIWSVSHAISDGICLIDLHRELLTLCDQMMQGNKLSVEWSNKGAVPESIEKMLPHRKDGKDIDRVTAEYQELIDQAPHRTLRTDFNEVKPSVLSADELFSDKQHIKVFTHRLSEERSNEILAWCKCRGLSFNDVFTAALFHSAKPLTDQHSFLMRTAVNLRGKVNPTVDKNVLMTAASSIITSTSMDKDEDLETTARKVKIAIAEALAESGTIENHLANKKIVGELAATLAFHMSNVGRLGLKNEFSSFSIEHFIMSPGTSCGKTIPVNVNTFSNRISITTHALGELYPVAYIESIILGAINQITYDELREDIYRRIA